MDPVQARFRMLNTGVSRHMERIEDAIAAHKAPGDKVESIVADLESFMLNLEAAARTATSKAQKAELDVQIEKLTSLLTQGNDSVAHMVRSEGTREQIQRFHAAIKRFRAVYLLNSRN
jgi:negative regulator of replication initiation